jgi:hypothetical protein
MSSPASPVLATTFVNQTQELLAAVEVGYPEFVLGQQPFGAILP